MESNDLTRQDIHKMVPNASLGFLGTTAYGLTVGMQENFYGKPQLVGRNCRKN